MYTLATEKLCLDMLQTKTRSKLLLADDGDMRNWIPLETKFRKGVDLIVNIDGSLSQKGPHGLDEYTLNILINFRIFGIYREYIAI